MTTFPCALVASMQRFWMSGTFSAPSSTPRSPRATMMPSAASMIASRQSIASGFSILAMIGMCLPSLRVASLTASSTSAGWRTNDSAMKSTPTSRPTKRSRRSFSVSAGAETFTPGRLMPLLFLSVPPMTTRVVTSVSSFSITSSDNKPSSSSSMSPGFTSPGSPVYVVETMSCVPGTSRVVKMRSAPGSSSIEPFTKRPTRILGPCRSCKIPTARPRFLASARTAAITSRC